MELEETTEESTNFEFSTTSSIRLEVNFSDSEGAPFKGLKFSIYESLEGETGKKLLTASTNTSGQLSQNLELPTYYESVIFKTDFVGVPSDIEIPVENGLVKVDYNNGALVSNLVIRSQSSGGNVAAQTAVSNTTITYMGSYDGRGVPSYLETDREVISATLLNYINASLPEAQPVPEYKPTYLANGKKTTLDIIELADVWITFVHEGAGWRNAIGFYTYNTNQPPQTIDDIEEIKVIFPNLSFRGSGGGLLSGDKVEIGRFEPGTSVGIVMLADGWDGNNSEDYKHLVFADKNLNPEPDDNLKQHNVLLWDDENELFLLGFEDVRRDEAWCDQDFNDAILFVTSNPVEAISKENVSPINKPGTLDTDGDGINDILDEYPDDANKAYDSYYPSSTSFGTFAFEDNWPDYGDYDFNDLVVDYQIKHVLNADNQVVEMEPTFKVRAIGAGFRNGFGFSTDLLPGDISSVEGASINGRIIQLNGNGTEANQEKAVFVAIDNVHDLFNVAGFVNTVDEETAYEPQSVTLKITLNGAKTYEEIGTVPYNPFVIISQNRGREVHLPGYQPTDLIDASLFGSQDDNSDVENGIYYRSRTDLPWGIHLPESFDYPKEKSDIREGHLRFKDWAQSFGYSYMDWYRNQNGYRNTAHIYKK